MELVEDYERLDHGKIKFGSSGDSDLKPFYYGLNAGTGLQFKKFQFTILYEFGLNDLGVNKSVYHESYKIQESYKIRNMVFSIVYLFGKGKTG